MVGQGVLRECLLDPDVRQVLSLARSPTGQQNPKLREILVKNFFDFSTLESDLSGFDACFFCLGVSSVGMNEADYQRVTYDLTLAAAQTLAKLNPGMTFIYVSGAGTDSTERGRSRWARVKGKTENALLQLPFKAYMFRPALIVPLHGIRSRTRFYRVIYTAAMPFLRLSYAWFPSYVTTTEQIGRAMIKVAKQGWPKPVLESSDITVFEPHAAHRADLQSSFRLPAAAAKYCRRNQNRQLAGRHLGRQWKKAFLSAISARHSQGGVKDEGARQRSKSLEHEVHKGRHPAGDPSGWRSAAKTKPGQKDHHHRFPGTSARPGQRLAGSQDCRRRQRYPTAIVSGSYSWLAAIARAVFPSRKCEERGVRKGFQLRCKPSLTSKAGGPGNAQSPARLPLDSVPVVR